MSATSQISSRLTDSFASSADMEIASLASLLRTILWLFCLIPLLSSLFSMFTACLTPRPCMRSRLLEPFLPAGYALLNNDSDSYAKYEHRRRQKKSNEEKVPELPKAEKSESYSEVKNLIPDGYHRILLTPPEAKEHVQSPLIAAEAHRYITDKPEYRLQIFANLYVLDGNILQFRDEKIDHSYKAYLEKNGDRVFLGKLIKDGDGVYKLQIKSKDIKQLLEYHTLSVIYEINGKENLILTGKF
jgi:hypothetical protein